MVINVNSTRAVVTNLKTTTNVTESPISVTKITRPSEILIYHLNNLLSTLISSLRVSCGTKRTFVTRFEVSSSVLLFLTIAKVGSL